jgi:heme A synthase
MQPGMSEHRLSVALAAATFALLVIGGLVHPTGSSLACPDWPLCNGEVFPRMTGGVLFEHGHRLAALTVAVLTGTVAAVVLRRRRDRSLRRLVGAAVALVLLQASLGALTVIFKLPLLVSTGHLATSMAFFTLTLVLASRLRPPAATYLPPVRRGVVLAAALATYAQIVVGAFVRHTGSALACGADLVLCKGEVWPELGPGRVHVLHRALGIAVAALVLAAAVRVLRDAHGPRRLLALAAPALVLLQLLLGLLTVATGVDLAIVSLHLAVGAALLADLVALHLSLGPRGAAARAEHGAGALAPAEG